MKKTEGRKSHDTLPLFCYSLLRACTLDNMFMELPNSVHSSWIYWTFGSCSSRSWGCTWSWTWPANRSPGRCPSHQNCTSILDGLNMCLKMLLKMISKILNETYSKSSVFIFPTYPLVNLHFSPIFHWSTFSLNLLPIGQSLIKPYYPYSTFHRSILI